MQDDRSYANQMGLLNLNVKRRRTVQNRIAPASS